MRLIDADKLEIRKFTDSEIRGYDHGAAYRAGWNDAIDAICENEPTLEQQKWIPCSERLPGIGSDGYSDKVLVSFNCATFVEICEYRVEDGVGKWYVGDMDESPEDIGLTVIAWMPLPEPYKAESEGE